MDDEQLAGRTVSGWEDFTPSVRTPIRDGKQYLGVVLYDWSDVSFMSGGLAYPPRMVVNLRETPERPAADYLVVFEQGRAICSGLLVHPRIGGVGLRKQDLAGLSPDKLVELALDAVVVPGHGGGGTDPDTGRMLGAWWSSGPRPLTPVERRKHDEQQVTHGRPRLTPEHYERVAALYVEHGTVQAVADQLEANYSTAARWVRDARAKGLLPMRDEGVEQA